MIYQCYPFTKDRIKLFSEEPYAGFGLEPESNDTLTLNCPELEDAAVRLQLTEYACCLWHWRNHNYDSDDWFGLTSYRQSKKQFTHIFTSKAEIEIALSKNPIVAWGEYRLIGASPTRAPLTLAEHTEQVHPGLNDYLEQTLNQFGHDMPAEWGTRTRGFFANYWVMKKELFAEFMEFSWPMIKNSLHTVAGGNCFTVNSDFGRVSNKKAMGYFAERLFILWYLNKRINPHNPGNLVKLHH